MNIQNIKKINKGLSLKGFSLIELIIVIAIIGILAAVAVPNYQRYMARTICAEVETTTHEVLLETVKYIAINNSVPDEDDLDITYSDGISNITISGNGTSDNPVTITGTAKDNRCPLGQQYILVDGDANGTWQ